VTIVTLTFDSGPLTKVNQHVKHKNFVINISQDNEQNLMFYKVTFVTLIFDKSEPKINRGHVHTNLQVKYESSVINSFSDNEQKHCFTKLPF